MNRYELKAWMNQKRDLLGAMTALLGVCAFVIGCAKGDLNMMIGGAVAVTVGTLVLI